MDVEKVDVNGVIGMSLHNDRWKRNAFDGGLGVNGFVGGFSFEQLHGHATVDVFGPLYVVDGTFAVGNVGVTNDLIVLLIGWPAELALLVSGFLCVLDLSTGVERFVLSNCVHKRVRSNRV